MNTLQALLKDSPYKLTQFSPEKIQTLEGRIGTVSGKSGVYVTCLVRGKPIKLTPEEAVRQLYILVLTEDYSYPTSRMQVEYEVNFGREKNALTAPARGSKTGGGNGDRGFGRSGAFLVANSGLSTDWVGFAAYLFAFCKTRATSRTRAKLALAYFEAS
jgi:hypothetical protein